MAIYDNYRLRYNTANALLEMNTGGEDWIPVPDSVTPGEVALPDGQVLIGNVSGVGAAATLSGDLSITNTGVATVANVLRLTGGTITPLSNSTTTLVVRKADATTRVLTVDTTNGIVSVGLPQVDATFGVTASGGVGDTLISATRQLGGNASASNVISNDQNYGLVLLAAGSTHSNTDIRNKACLYSPTAGMRFCSVDTGSPIDFSFGSLSNANVKLAMDSTGSFTRYANTPTVGTGLSSILAKVALTAQAADIGSTVIFTAPATGLYKVDAYAVATAADAGAGSLSMALSFTDNFGVQPYTGFMELNLANAGEYSSGYSPLEITSGSTLSFTFTGGGTYGTARYSLYITVTRLN